MFPLCPNFRILHMHCKYNVVLFPDNLTMPSLFIEVLMLFLMQPSNRLVAVGWVIKNMERGIEINKLVVRFE